MVRGPGISHPGQDLTGTLAEAEEAPVADLGALRRTQFTSLGCRWSVGLANQAARIGALVVAEPGDPMAELARVQRLAAATGLAKRLDPDNPRHLARSVVLQSGTASRRVP